MKDSTPRDCARRLDASSAFAVDEAWKVELAGPENVDHSMATFFIHLLKKGESHYEGGYGKLTGDALLSWMGPALLELQRKRLAECRIASSTIRPAEEEAPLTFRHARMLKDYKRAGEALRIPQPTETMYKLRHGSASRNVRGNRRSLLTMPRRGSSASPPSLSRYGRSGHLLVQISKLDRRNIAAKQKLLEGEKRVLRKMP